MSDFDSEGPFEYEWDDRGDLAWNEFDWERYLREQDEAVGRYMEIYESLPAGQDRIDEAARRMGWEPAEADAADDDAGEEDDGFVGEGEVYTLHKNPVFVATKAICRGLVASWQHAAEDPARGSAQLALSFLVSLKVAEDHAVQAIHALDFGDYAMAVSLFKRALAALNGSLAVLNGARDAGSRESALSRLFDLREIWLRVINECRQELERPLDE